MKHIKKYNENTGIILTKEEFLNIFQEIIDLDLPDILIDSSSNNNLHSIIICQLKRLSITEMLDLYKCLDSCDKRMPNNYEKDYIMSALSEVKISINYYYS